MYGLIYSPIFSEPTREEEDGWMAGMNGRWDEMRWVGTLTEPEQNSKRPKLVVEGIGLSVFNLIIEFNHCSFLDILASEMFYSNWNIHKRDSQDILLLNHCFQFDNYYYYQKQNGKWKETGWDDRQCQN